MELVLARVRKPFEWYRLMNWAQKIHAVLIRDPSILVVAEELSESFVDYPRVLLVNLFCGYI